MGSYTENKGNAPEIEDSGKITLESFARFVKQMRHNQRRYWARREEKVLETCRAYEKECDAIIRELFDDQLKLF